MNAQAQHEGELIAMADKGKILLLSFRSEGKDISPSIFKDNAPALEIGKRYRFTTEEKLYQGKPYLNLKTKWRGKDTVGYFIEELEGGGNFSSHAVAPTQPPSTSKDPREEYWKNREKLDIERSKAMERGGYSHDAATIVAAMLNAGVMIGDPITKVIEYTKRLVEEGSK